MPTGGGSGTVNASGGTNRLTYYSTASNTVDALAAITGLRALASDVNGLPVASPTTATELGYLSGVTSGVQSQLNGKQGNLTLTTTGSSGAATLIGNTLNIPQYSGGGSPGLSDSTAVLRTRYDQSFTSISQVNDSTMTLNRHNGTKDTVQINTGSSSGGTTYTAGAGIDITGTVISATTGNAPSLVTVNNSNYTVAAGVTHVLYNGTFTANRTVTLPSAAANVNRLITIKHGGAGTFSILFNVNPKQAISGVGEVGGVGQFEWITIMSDGTDWWVVAVAG